jgi:hypothetical protein
MYMENKLFNFQRFFCFDCNIVYSVDDLMEKNDHTCPICSAEPSKKFLNDLTIGNKVTFIAKKDMVLPKYDENHQESNVPLRFKKDQSFFGFVKNVMFEKEMGGTCVELSIGSLGYTVIPLVDFQMDNSYFKERAMNKREVYHEQHFVPSDKFTHKFNAPVKRSIQTQYELDTERFKVFINKYDADSKVDVLLLTLRSLSVKEKNISDIIGIVNKDLGF